MARRKRKKSFRIRFKRKFPFVQFGGGKRKQFDIEFYNTGSFINICPVTAKGKRWAGRNLRGALKHGDCYPAEGRFAWDIAQGAKHDKLKIGP